MWFHVQLLAWMGRIGVSCVVSEQLKSSRFMCGFSYHLHSYWLKCHLFLWSDECMSCIVILWNSYILLQDASQNILIVCIEFAVFPPSHKFAR
jgi:hypothetical protein